jgi:hypothetical protein
VVGKVGVFCPPVSVLTRGHLKCAGLLVIGCGWCLVTGHAELRADIFQFAVVKVKNVSVLIFRDSLISHFLGVTALINRTIAPANPALQL